MAVLLMEQIISFERPLSKTSWWDWLRPSVDGFANKKIKELISEQEEIHYDQYEAEWKASKFKASRTRSRGSLSDGEKAPCHLYC